MSYEVKNPKANWYIKLMERFNSMMERLGMPEDVSSEVKVLLLEVAKEQYMTGNKSGIRWAREQMQKTPA